MMPTTKDKFNFKMSLLQRWLYALKLASWPKILIPFFLGQALGINETGEINWHVFIFSLLAVINGVIFIVLMNDWGDQKVDKIKRKMFPDGCSPKTIPDEILPANQLLKGGIFAGSLAFISVVFSGIYTVSPLQALIYASISCLLFIAYTLPPIKLNYRGGGEILEMLGVGIVLPHFMSFLQSGKIIPLGFFQIILPFSLLSLASAIASSISDEQSDIEGGKTTFTTLFGNKWSRIFIEVLLPTSVILSLLISRGYENVLTLWLMAFIQLIVVYYYLKMRKISHLVQTNAFQQQKIYKYHLHNAIWISAFATAFFLILKNVIN